MYIREVHIKNFGKLRDKRIEFSPGLNVIYGENESGKSTLQAFLTGMLFGMEKSRGRRRRDAPYEKYEPWEASAFYAGTMRFTAGGRDFYLERNFYHKEKSARLVNERDGEELSVEHGDLQMLFGDISKDVYENTYCIGQECIKPGAVLGDCLKDEMHNLSETGDGSFQLSRALQYLQKERRKKTALLKEKEAVQMRQKEMLQAEEKVLAEQKEKLERRIQNQEEQISQCEQNRRLQKEQCQRNEMAQMRYYHPAAVLGLIFSFVWFVIWRQNQIAVPLWAAGQIALLIVFAAGLRETWKNPQRIAGQKIHEMEEKTEAELEKQKAVLAVLKEEAREKELELENNRNRRRELQSVVSEAENLQMEVRAIGLAGETLAGLSAETGKTCGKALEKTTENIFRQMTGNRRRSVRFSETGELQVTSGYKAEQPESFSTGTTQQLYFAYRMAAGKFLEKEEALPFFLDETFAQYDRKRLDQALCWLGEQDRQILLFTCQEREAERLRELNIPFSEIRMTGASDQLFS